MGRITSERLACGVRVVMEEMPEAQAACIGIWVGAGSACEKREEAGISHFLEHMMFKGTHTRSAKQIAVDIDEIGASINAFTGKEATCYHVKALSEVFDQAVATLLDMLCNSVLDSKEIQKERSVILEEMKMIQDTPDQYIIDLLTQNVLKGSAFAPSIIGTKSSLRTLSRPKMIRYLDRYYTRDNIVVSVVGCFDRSKLFEQLEAALSNFPETAESRSDGQVLPGVRHQSCVKDIAQTHIALGRRGVSLGSPHYFAEAVANDVLGGSMSSRLFQNIREERGLAYSVYSAGLSYSTDGMYVIYAGVGDGKVQETLSAIAEELLLLRADGLEQTQIDIVKRRLKSGFVFSLESMNRRMIRLGRNLLLLDRIYRPEEVTAEIDAVTADEVREMCQRIGDLSAYSSVSISSEKLPLSRMIATSTASV